MFVCEKDTSYIPYYKNILKNRKKAFILKASELKAFFLLF